VVLTANVFSRISPLDEPAQYMMPTYESLFA
jgi:hypothetical protein